jgi:hypothetical protein
MPDCLGDLACLPTSVWMSTFALSNSRADLPPIGCITVARPTPALTSAWVVPGDGMGMLPVAARPLEPASATAHLASGNSTRRPVRCWHACCTEGASGNGTSTADAT